MWISQSSWQTAVRLKHCWEVKNDLLGNFNGYFLKFLRICLVLCLQNHARGGMWIFAFEKENLAKSCHHMLNLCEVWRLHFGGGELAKTLQIHLVLLQSKHILAQSHTNSAPTRLSNAFVMGVEIYFVFGSGQSDTGQHPWFAITVVFTYKGWKG